MTSAETRIPRHWSLVVGFSLDCIFLPALESILRIRRRRVERNGFFGFFIFASFAMLRVLVGKRHGVNMKVEGAMKKG